jgi:hypothetical protein
MMQVWHKMVLLWLPLAVLGVAGICHIIWRRLHR